MSTILPSIILALSLALQDPSPTPCPPKTTACADNSCSPIGVPCPSANETAVATGQPVTPAVVDSSPEVETAPTAASEAHEREWAYKSAKLAASRSRRSENCLESIDSFERRKTLRRLFLVLPGVAALSSSLGFALAARTIRIGVEDGNRAGAALAASYGVEYTNVSDFGLRGAYVAGSVVFGLVGAGLIIGGIVSPNNMERAGGRCSARGCTLVLRF